MNEVTNIPSKPVERQVIKFNVKKNDKKSINVGEHFEFHDKEQVKKSNVSTVIGGDPEAPHSLLLPGGSGGRNSSPKCFHNLTLSPTL